MTTAEKTRIDTSLAFAPRDLKPSPENARIYRPVNADDPEVIALAQDIAANGVLEPIKITNDNYIQSGHRRQVAAILAGLETVPCQRVDIVRGDGAEPIDPDEYIRALVSHNQQRIKNRAEQAREAFVNVDIEGSYQRLIEYRKESSRVKAKLIQVSKRGKRPKINMNLKGAMVKAVLSVVFAAMDFWPMSLRRVHYRLLNDPPIRSERTGLYANDSKSYGDLSKMLTRLRLNGDVPWDAIADETRPMTIWQVDPSPRAFIDRELHGFLKNYRRNLQQSQPNHIEVIAEKLTVQSIIRPVCMKYNVPYSIGRGFASITMLKDLADRFLMSGKERLVLLLLSDFDPDGLGLAESIVKVLREDFLIDNVDAVRVAVDPEHIKRFQLTASYETPKKPGNAKKSSSRYDEFVRRYGKVIYELEALEEIELQQLLQEAIDGVMDIDMFNCELSAEKKDWGMIDPIRREVIDTTRDYLSEMEFDE